jgi:hypothetical protein
VHISLCVFLLLCNCVFMSLCLFVEIFFQNAKGLCLFVYGGLCLFA